MRACSPRTFLRDLSIPHKLSLVIALFSIVVIVLLLLAYFGLEMLSGSRAYVGGEGLWSKAQKGAVYQLTRYARFQHEADDRKYQEHMAISLGDRQAPLELARRGFDPIIVARGFIQGRNHPDDVAIMSFMARRFHAMPYMEKAMELWARADGYMEQLQEVATRLHGEMTATHPSAGRVGELLEEIRLIDSQVTQVEDEFSYTLGEGVRWLKRALLTTMVATTCVFLALALLVACFISRHLQLVNGLLDSPEQGIPGRPLTGLPPALLPSPTTPAAEASIRLLNASLTRRAGELEVANGELEAFSYSVSHDLRRPLRVIDGFSTTLLQQHSKGLDPEGQRLLMLVGDTARQMDRLIEDLLRLARLPLSGLNRKRVDVSAIALEVAAELTRREPLRRATIAIEPAQSAYADAGLLRAVFDNLLGNAWKFSARQPDIRIEMGTLQREEQKVFFVRDNGAGFDMRYAGKLFLPFRRLHREEEFSGTGIGLATVQRIVQRHGGKIWAESTVGQGATFYFTLPEQDNLSGSDQP